MRFSDAERRQLAVLGKKLGRKALSDVATLATPDTILRWYRELVTKKYDGSARRGPGRPRKAAEIARLLVEMATRNTGWRNVDLPPPVVVTPSEPSIAYAPMGVDLQESHVCGNSPLTAGAAWLS